MISVIIPVYNCESYIEKAVLSAVNQDFVSEIIIIDDGSTDDSYILVSKLEKSHNKIMFYQHVDKKNHGRSATRNFGIKNASNEYIAFLDADDYYLPNRFVNDVSVLNNDQSIDGVYNAISAFFYRDFTKLESEKLKLTTIREVLNPEDLFENMGPIGGLGYFSGIGLTVRKKILVELGGFNDALFVGEDTELWIKLALKAKLVGGIIDQPVAIRGVHDNNTSFKNEVLYNTNNLTMYHSLFSWCLVNNISLDRIIHIWRKIWQNRLINKTSFISNMTFWIKNVIRIPKLLCYKITHKEFPVFRKIKTIIK